MTEFDSPGGGRPRRGMPEVPEEDDSPTMVNMPVPRRSALTPSSPGTPLSPFPNPVPRRSALTPTSPVTASPMPRRSALTPSSAASPGHWRVVGRNDDGAKPPLPVWVKSTAIGVLVLFVVVAGWLVFNLASPPSPVNSPSSSPSSSAASEAALPKQMGDYVAGDIIEHETSSPDETLVSANYSDGSNKLLVQLYRPETDINAYIEKVGILEPVEVGSAMCGTLEGRQIPMCAKVAGQTVIAVGGHSGQSPETLAALVDEFHSRLSG
ncbi:MAG: hypothetical protein Q4D96_09975 [Propionibacteriaceae bacterium]|nr:hypothetical protein [Propionibacteriaceae bacterium]